MPASCYTVRPSPESGWLTFFELSPDRRCEGFFFVLGPLHVSPDSRRMAQGMARQIVVAYKRMLDPDPAAWLDEVRRICAAETGQLEFGALTLSGERLWALQGGRVRLIPLTAAARLRAPAPATPSVGGAPESRTVANGDRLFFGRLPREAAGAQAPGEVVRGLEQGGGGDGALIVSIHSLRGEAFRLPDDEAERGGSGRTPGAPPERGSHGSPPPRGRGVSRLLILGLTLLVLAVAVWWFFLRPA